MSNILLVLYPNPPMKAAPCLPFSWIWKVFNYFVWLKVKVPKRGQVIFINIYFLWRLCLLWFWFILLLIYLVSLLEPSKMNISTISIFFLGSGIYGWTSKYYSLHFSVFIHAHTIAFIKPWCNHIFLIGVLSMLLIHM